MTKKAQNNSKAEDKAASAAPAANATKAPGNGAENLNPGADTPGEKEQEKPSQNPPKEESKKGSAKEKAGDTAEKQLRKKLQPYFDAHPSTDVFYVASDGQPFFEAQWAREHQKTVDPKEKVSIVNR